MNNHAILARTAVNTPSAAVALAGSPSLRVTHWPADGEKTRVHAPHTSFPTTTSAATFGVCWPDMLNMQAVTTLILMTAGLIALVGSDSALQFPVADLLKPVAFCAGLTLVARFYERKGVQNFVLCLKSLVALIAFSAIYSMLTYCVAEQTPFEWADTTLASIDAMFGLSAAATVTYVGSSSALGAILYLAYFSVIPQTFLTVAYHGLSNNQRLVTFIVRFMLCALVTAVGFYFFPARGNVAGGVPDHYSNILAHLESLRDGSRSLVTWRDAEGLITFPSFHTIWGVLVIAAFHRTRLFLPVLVLNVAMIASTIPIGLHYYVDVAGGLIVATTVILLTRHHEQDYSSSTVCG